MKRLVADMEKFYEQIGLRKEEITKLDIKRFALRCKWIENELNELKEACYTVDQVDALIDIIYLTVGTMIK